MVILYVVEENIFVIIAFSTKEILKRHMYKINGKQRVIIPKDWLNSKFME